MPKKTKGVILLIVWFIWAAIKDISSLVRPSTATDHAILSSAGLGGLFFVMALVIFVLNTASVVFLLRPRRAGIFILFNALVAATVQGTFTIAAALTNLPGAREAYMHSKRQQGLPVRAEALNSIFTSGTLTIAWAMMLAFYALAMAGTSNDRAQATLDCFIAELHRFSEGVTKDELDRAKIGLKASTIMQGESTSARAGAIAHDYFIRGRIRTLDEIKAAIDGITLDQVNAYLKTHRPGPFTIVTVGPKELVIP